MEFDYGFYMLFFVMIGVIAVLLYRNTSQKGSKRAKKTIETFSIDTMTEEYTKMKTFFEDKCATLEKELKHWRGRAVRLEQIDSQDDNDNNSTPKISAKNLEEHYEIDISSVTKLLPTLNIPMLQNIDMTKIPELINNPIIKNKAWDYIKKNKDEMISMGVIVPIGQVTQTQEVESKQTEIESNQSDMMNLSFTNENSKYMS